jgi:hypothetical protein
VRRRGWGRRRAQRLVGADPGPDGLGQEVRPGDRVRAPQRRSAGDGEDERQPRRHGDPRGSTAAPSTVDPPKRHGGHDTRLVGGGEADARPPRYGRGCPHPTRRYDEPHAPPRHRHRRLHRLPRGRAAPRPRRRGDRSRHRERLLRRHPEGGAPRPPGAPPRLPPRARRPRRRRRHGARLRRRPARAGDPPRRPGRGALLAHAPGSLRAEQPGGLPPRAGGVPPGGRRAPDLRQQQQRLRRQHGHAVLGPPERRPPAQPLRRQQEGQRGDGAHLRPPVRAADHGAALLHRLRPVGSARHGDVHLHEGDPGGRADRRVQPRPHAARLHLRGRRRGGDRPRERPARRARTRPGRAMRRTPAAPSPPGACTTSATTRRWNS